MFLRRQAEATGWRPETSASGRQPLRLRWVNATGAAKLAS